MLVLNHTAARCTCTLIALAAADAAGTHMYKKHIEHEDLPMMYCTLRCAPCWMEGALMFGAADRPRVWHLASGAPLLLVVRQ